MPEGQANATSGEATSDEVKASPDEASGDATDGAFQYKIDRSKAGTAAPDFAFALGKDDQTLKDYAGKPLLVNLWATWCAPCIAEMPLLDRIAGAYAQQGLQVLTISQDTQGAAQVDPFFAKNGFAHLKPFLDTENRFGFHYGTGVLPTTVVYGADGKEVARVVGAMDWESAEGKALIAEALKAG